MMQYTFGNRSFRRALFLSAWYAIPTFAQSHPTGVPQLSSKPGAAYTIYLDFAGFDFSGNWINSSGATPGVMGSYMGATTSFTAAEQTDIEQVWAHVAEKYSAFNVNVTTVDPAAAAGQAATDAQRQAYYDSKAHMMHTIIGSEDGWNDNGGVSVVGATKNSYGTSGNNGASYGLHTDFVFTNGVGTGQQDVGEAAAHENGHGFGLSHQADYIGTTEESGYSSNNSAEGNGSIAPTMGVSYYSQRGLWRLGPYEGGGGATQNDVAIIENNPGMGTYTDDGVGNTPSAASLLPVAGTTVNDAFARGIIVPISTSSPNPVGSVNYTADYFAFNSGGGSVSLTVHNGAERISYGTADPGVTLNSVLTIYNVSGGMVATAATNFSSQSETITQTLPAGKYYAEVSAAGNDHSSFDTPTDFYGMGSFFITGSGVSGGLATNLYWAGGAASSKWNQLAGGVSNWRTDAAGSTDPGQTPSSPVNVYLTATTGTAGSMTLGANTSINSLTFTGTGTTNATTGIALNADGSSLTILANTSNSAYVTTGLTVAAGAAADTISVPVVLGNSQIWAINNSTSAPITINGVISDGSNSFGIFKTGSGELILAAANTFDGNSNLNGGTLLLAHQLALQNVTLTDTGGALLFDNSVSAFIMGGLAGSSNIALQNNAATPAAIALSVGNDGDSTTYSGVLSGAGSLNIIGGASLVLSGNNTFTGGLVVTSGTVTIEGNQPAANGSITLTGDSSSDSETLNVTGGASISVAAGKAIQIGNSNGGNHSPALVSSAGTVNNLGSLTIARSGNLQLSNGAVWNQSGGLALNAVGGYGDSLNIGSGATFNYNGSGAIGFIDGASGGSSVLTIDGGVFNTSAAFKLVTHNSGSDEIILTNGGTIGTTSNISSLFTSNSSTPIAVSLGTGGGIINTNANAVTIGTNIGGSGSLTKAGAGLLSLTTPSNYSGGTVIASGPLLVTNSGALGSGSITIDNGGSSTASIQLSGGITLANSFAGFASELGSATPTIENISGNNTIIAPLSISSTGGNGAIFQSDAGLLTLSGGLSTSLTTSRGYYLQGAGNGLITGNITDSASNILFVTKSGGGTWTLTGNNTYAAGTDVNAGMLAIGNGSTTGNLGGGTLSIADGATVSFNRSDSPTYQNRVTLTGGTATMNIAGSAVTLSNVISGTGGLFLSTGTLNLTNTETFTGAITVNANAVLNVEGALTSTSPVTAGGRVNFSAGPGAGPVYVRTDGPLTINNGGQITVAVAAMHTARTLLMTPALSIAAANTSWAGLLDLGNNDLDVQGGSLALITSQIQQSYNNGGWNGAGGIVSSAAAADNSSLTALGAILNGGVYGTAAGSLGLFDGINPAATDILVKYTYYGDSNLDGQVDGSDYTLIDNGYNNNLTGWYNGDYNYDGVVDGSDYTLIDNALNVQGGSLSATAQIAHFTAEPSQDSPAVPEPASALPLTAAILRLLLRRRTKHS